MWKESERIWLAMRLTKGRAKSLQFTAEAQIATHTLTDLIIAERGVLGAHIGAHGTGPARFDLAQHGDGRADPPWGTVAALEGVVFDKRLLQRVQARIIGEPLNCDDLGILMRGSCSRAGRQAERYRRRTAHGRSLS